MNLPTLGAQQSEMDGGRRRSGMIGAIFVQIAGIDMTGDLIMRMYGFKFAVSE